MKTERNLQNWNLVVQVVSGLLIPVAIFYAGHKLSDQQKQTDRLNQNMQILALVVSGLSGNEEQKRIAFGVIEYLSAQGSLPENVREVLRFSTDPRAKRVIGKEWIGTWDHLYM